MAWSLVNIIGGLTVAWLIQKILTIAYNYFLHPLAKFPGPPSVCTGWFKTNQEVFQAKNWTDVLFELHAKYGEVVRVGVNELHFSNPSAYHEIYHPSIRWDKEKSLYHSFGEDRSSFGFLTYREAKARRDVITPFFSRRAIASLEERLVRGNIDRLCAALRKNGEDGKKSCDMLFALRSYTLNTIMEYCFDHDPEAPEATDFKHPILVAMDAALASFIVFRNFEIVRRIVFSLPGWLTKLTTPEMGGLVDLQRLLGAQVKEVVSHPETLQKTNHPIIYHHLLDPTINRESGVPSPGSLYEEAQAMMFAGADTAADALYAALYHILRSPDITSKLQTELRTIWPDLHTPNPPRLETLEKLPYLTAIVKEALRTTPGVPAPLLRIVPSPHGATISNHAIPPGTIVGQSMHFVHRNATIFPSPETFSPDRWLPTTTTTSSPSANLDKHLVTFSRGPRSCLGQNLGLCEMYIAFAHLFRRLEMVMEVETKEEEVLRWRDAFSPAFGETHMMVFCKAVEG